ncbi:hypothetical protein EI546_01210 [Aequorivita sp. H23M31]|uniref:2'-5' RNA ligase family protein n=1 Tax=Aequorivita ciconiae TaxID=2494375 RepID=A0A410FZK1_9FLAO|nr:hypothetical protein [Aequorivita sp. H23M31]QAA80430.1 hypothetical protein EI546_01210 [Aequorivita sp. H23M31]
MRRILFFIISIIGLGIISCGSKKEKTIAIDVLLIPSEKMWKQAIEYNDLIVKSNTTTLKLDKDHIPHITLLQCFIDENDLPEVEKALTGLYGIIEKDSLFAKSLFFDKNTEKSFAMITIEKSEPLMELHAKSIELLKPYIVNDGTEAAFVPNPDGTAIDTFTVSYVSNFVSQHSSGNYDPHISLGVGDLELLKRMDNDIFKPIYFEASALAIYHLGNFGTAQKQLWKSKK